MAKWSKSEKSWERQQGETSQAYEAFDIYLKMGKGRSITKVAQTCNKNRGLIGRWSSAWNWQERVRDYENDLKRQEFEEEQKQTRNMRKRQIQTAMLLQKKAVEALDKLNIEDLSPQEILRFISEGAKLERETRQDSAAAAAKDNGQDGGGGSSLADAIINAYRNRKERDGGA